MQLAAITDEFSPDIEVALDAMASVGLSGVELRTIRGRHVVDLPDHEVDHLCAAIDARGLEIVSIASPLLKCVLPDAPRSIRGFNAMYSGAATRLRNSLG